MLFIAPLPLDAINDLDPPFCDGSGWLSIAELNLIDPNCCRFEIIDESIFIDGSVFVLVESVD